MRTRVLAAGLIVASLSSPAFAEDTQAAMPMRVRGTIERLDGSNLVIKARNGSDVTVVLAPGFGVGTLKKARLEDIKPGDFIGSAAVKGPDGKLRALEVHIFPEAMRGTGEGQRPWDLGTDSSMTNATVGEVASTSEGGRSLSLTYKGGAATIDVPNDVPIVTFAPGDPSMIAPGRTVILFAIKQPDGTFAANRITVENDGVKPPM
jgi:hypothetical protein